MIPLPLNRLIAAKHLHIRHCAVEQGQAAGIGLPHALDADDAVLGADQRDGVHSISVTGKADILTGKVTGNRIGELTFLHLCGAFLGITPKAGAVHSLVVYLHPCSHGPEDLHILVGQGSVGFGAEVEQQAAILAHHIHQITSLGSL